MSRSSTNLSPVARFGPLELPDAIQVCLAAAFPELRSPDDDLSEGKALAKSLLNQYYQLQPDSAVGHYNFLALDWASGGYSFLSDSQTLEEELEAIIGLDPSLPGPYIMRAMHAITLPIDQSDFAAIEEDLKTAINLLPNVPELHVNLGQVYALQGRSAAAEAAIQVALSQDSHNWEALLAMANLIYHEDGGEAAAVYLAQIPHPAWAAFK